jgi:uncharacterized Rmd1/YagE family protein
MNVQRATKPLISVIRRQLIPFATPAVITDADRMRVTARVLFPALYSVQSSEFLHSTRFARGSKSNPVFDLRHVQQLVSQPIDQVHSDGASSPYLYINSMDPNGEYVDTAVLFPDGVLVTWYMDKQKEMDLATDLIANFSRTLELPGSKKEQVAAGQFSSMDTIESMSISNISTSSPVSRISDSGSLHLTGVDTSRSDDMLTVSMAIASAARMNVIESHLQDHIETGHSRITKLLQTLSGWKLSRISESIFEAEQLVHNWRYFLTQKGIDDTPDSLWDHERLDRLYEELTSHFVLKRRFTDLNNDLTYYSDYLSTVGEHVRHKYSSRLEIIIILIIGIEAGIATRHLVVDLLA